MDEIETTVSAVRQWLHLTTPIEPVCILVLDPNQAEGKYWLSRKQPTPSATGFIVHEANMIVLIGRPDDPVFWNIVRHEAAHFVLMNACPDYSNIPFWLDEGIATLFETGLDADGRPLPNPHRLQCLHHLSRTRRSLYIKRLVSVASPRYQTGHAYARAWGIMTYLYQTQRQPVDYLHALASQGTSMGLFEQHILAENETLMDFERAIVSRLIIE